MKSNIEQLKSRGYIGAIDISIYKDYKKSVLLEMLDSNDAQKRTISATMLSDFHDIKVVKALISRLKKEKKLYTKIAICETLASYGDLSIDLLINQLGLIGNNQHKSLPTKKFEKSSYPLPRDIIARIISKMDTVAINPLLECLKKGSRDQILEAIDAIGFISYYKKDDTALEVIIDMFDIYKDDDLIIWKLLRSLQAFDGDEVTDILTKYSKSDIIQYKWEAERSQINHKIK